MTRRAPLLALAAGFAAGAALPAPREAAWTAALGLPLALSPALAPVAFAAAGVLAAAAVDAGVSGQSPSAPPSSAGAAEVLEGRVASVPERLRERTRFVLRERSGRLVMVLAPPCAWPLAWGDEVRVAAVVLAPDGARNPGGRDPAALLAARGIASVASARMPPARLAPPSPLSWLEEGRSRLAAAAGSALPPREAALVRAIGAGDRSALDPATEEAFGRSGLAHLLSVSGLHLAVVALGAWRGLRALLLRIDAVAARVDARRAAAALALPLAGLYALATGADVPVVRSALAAGLGFAGVLLDREAGALPAMALGLLAVLAAEPGALHDVSLQLSFASVAGLALLTRPVRQALPWRPAPGRAGRAAEAVLASLAASLAAAMATAPLVALHFRRVSLLSPVANLVGVPVGSALTLSSAGAAVAAALWPPLALPFLWASWPLASLLLRASDLFAAPGAAAVGLASPGPLGVAVSWLGLAGAFALRGRGRRVACALLAVAGMAAAGPLRALAAARRGLLEVVFLSVGQGDATFLRLPDGAALLVDGGGDPRGRRDPGRRDVLPFLRDAGVRRLWLAAYSHPHADHLLGLVSAVAELPAERVLGNGRSGGEEMAAALSRLPPAAPLRRGEALERAGVRLASLAPPPGSEAWSENDASLVLRVEHGKVAILLAGDVEQEGEEALLASGARLEADVVKVPHHGSRTSSGQRLVAATRPRFAVISVGRRNPFGFPAEEVEARWRAAGAQVLRTDAGAVRFLSDGERIWRAPAEGAIDAWAMWGERRGRRAGTSPGGAPP
ncbi:MAG TPA: DNA internalization-related competence protein ComEC/Rec2 [Anaeromyxobacteraceae bacterium]|nr:DNA internalization-related competence protein ComEC/Rec2 [Anaeromyxobacteraceae bacterium]